MPSKYIFVDGQPLEQGEEIVEKVATEFSDVSFDDLGTDKSE